MNESQKRFCWMIAVDGLTPTAAYSAVSDCKPHTAATMAGRWMKKVDIVAEIERLSTKKEQEREREATARSLARVWDKVERMTRLQAWAEEAAGEGRYADSIRAVAELNRMDGAYEPEKVQVGVQGTFAAVMEEIMSKQ